MFICEENYYYLGFWGFGADPAAWATKYEAAKSEARHTAAKRAVQDAYERLGALVD